MQDEQVFASMTAEALKFPYLIEAHTVRCPQCNTVLGEYLFGVAKFTCRRCKWGGLIIRTGPTMMKSSVTIRTGDYRPDRHDPRS
jgi:phage FluMu protein Com